MVKAFFSQEATEFGGQMGCMATMFQIFDRRRLLTGRRHGDCPGTMDELPPAVAGTSALLTFHYYFAICSQLKKPSIPLNGIIESIFSFVVLLFIIIPEQRQTSTAEAPLHQREAKATAYIQINRWNLCDCY